VDREINPGLDLTCQRTLGRTQQGDQEHCWIETVCQHVSDSCVSTGKPVKQIQYLSNRNELFVYQLINIS